MIDIITITDVIIAENIVDPARDISTMGDATILKDYNEVLEIGIMSPNTDFVGTLMLIPRDVKIMTLSCDPLGLETSIATLELNQITTRIWKIDMSYRSLTTS